MRTLVLGFDAFDPIVFEHLLEQGKAANLGRYVGNGGYARLAVSNPPQSEVSWTSLATGLNPGAHGIFDFVQRDPASNRPYLSLLRIVGGPGGTRFAPPFRARTVFDEAARQGYPATSMWWPATFPARPESPVRTLPGLGTPDLLGRLGVGTLLSEDGGDAARLRATRFGTLQKRGCCSYSGVLAGPARQKGQGSEEHPVLLELDVVDDQSARLAVGGCPVSLRLGEWSPILDIPIRMGPLAALRGLTRAVLTQLRPHVRMYVLPLQLHPLHSPWRYASPRGFVRRIWRTDGPFLTLGWQQDTTALEEGCISDSQFLDLCEAIFQTRERILMGEIEHFHEGLLAAVFDCLDRVQHMYWRDRPDIIESWYARLDALLGRVDQRLSLSSGGAARLVVVSDHGFTRFDHKVHLNRWLLDHGYLVPRAGHGEGILGGIDWLRTQAFAVGLNSLYVNLEGRDAQGTVPSHQYQPLLSELCSALADWRGPDGLAVVRRALPRSIAFCGPLAGNAPDIVVGYASGYRASAETGLGQWKATSLEPNQDHWTGDHCVDPDIVPGVLFSSDGLRGLPAPAYPDFPRLVLGSELPAGDSQPPGLLRHEEMQAVEERLRGFGYL